MLIARRSQIAFIGDASYAVSRVSFHVARKAGMRDNAALQIMLHFDTPTPMEYRIPQYVTVVQREAAPRRNVQRVVVHAGVAEIADDAFRDWTNLVEVVFEPGSRLKKVGDHAFADTALREFAAPEGLKEIGSGTFMNCKELRTVKLNKGLE